MEKILNYIYIKESNIINLINSVVNLFLLCKKEDKKLFIDFIVTTKNILIKPLLDIYNYGIKIINNKIKNENFPFYENMKEKYEEFKNLINELEQKKKLYEKEYLEKIKDIEYLDDEYLCVICLRQIADYTIKPCSHKGCKECLLTYLVDNDKCFMCRQPYESIRMIPKEEINKIIQEAKSTKTGEELENKEEE